MTTLTVGSQKEYSTLNAAIAASHDGDVIDIDPGTYVNDFATITTKITIQGVGGLATLMATTASPNDKAILTVDADVTISNVAFSGATSSSGNGAGIRDESGNLTLVADLFSNNQDGLLANDNPRGSVNIVDSEFSHNGAGDGFTHNIYVNQLGALTISGSYIHDAVGGNEVKSRALSTTITNTRIIDGSQQTGGAYDVDLPNGGAATLTNDVIEKGAQEPNATMIHFGGEAAPYSASKLTVSSNVLASDDQAHPGVVVNNDQSHGPGATASVTGNTIYNVQAANVLLGPGTGSPNTLTSGTVMTASATPDQGSALVDVSVAGAVNGGQGRAINPFSATSISVVDDATVTLTLAGAAHGQLAYTGGDDAITVAANAGQLAATGPASRIAADLAAGLFTYTHDAGAANDAVSATLADPNVFLMFTPGQAATAATGFSAAINGMACFVAGTRIATDQGESAVETLAIGDRLITRDGQAKPVRWIGRRSFGGRFLAGQPHLQPVRIEAGALADGVPLRDLLVSPLHAMLLNEVLVPAGELINGRSIRREERLDRVDYFHVELDTHDVIWAEGALSETFHETDGRGIFHNAADYTRLYPNQRDAGAPYPASRVVDGPTLAAIHHHLRMRAEAKVIPQAAPQPKPPRAA